MTIPRVSQITLVGDNSDLDVWFYAFTSVLLSATLSYRLLLPNSSHPQSLLFSNSLTDPYTSLLLASGAISLVSQILCS